jgi:8-oxo-dGTP diphosphatase
MCSVCQSPLKKVLMEATELPRIPTMIPVVAVALIAPDGRVLMQRRREDRPFAGLWEFPGGKVEPGESLESALVREAGEELGIGLDPAALEPLSFASDSRLPPAPRQPHVILLYTCRSWSGEPRCLDAAALGWFAPPDLRQLPMPPLDVPLAEALIRALQLRE